MKKLKILFLSISILAIVGCEEIYEIGDLYVQKIENSSKVIYNYSAWSKYNDSHRFGYAILDSTEQILVSKLRDLPISYFENIPNKNYIDAINLIKVNDEVETSISPIRKYSIQEEGIKFNIKEFEEYQGYSSINCSLEEYNFNFLKETRDSLFFYGINEIRNPEIEIFENIAFKKGNIKVFDDKNANIVKIEIEQINIVKADKYFYKKGTNEIKDTIKNSPVICIKTFYFTPKKQTSSKTISDYGIFKQIR